MKSLKRFRNVIYFIYLPFFLNFVLNLYSSFQLKTLSDINFYNLISTFILFMFLFCVGRLIKDTVNLEYVSTGIVIYLLSFFLLDNLILFFYTDLNFKNLFLSVNILWLAYLLIFKKEYFSCFAATSLIYALNFYNRNFFNYLSIDKNIIGDVKDIHYTHVKNIYEVSYYYSMNNATLEGYPQLVAYIQSLLNIISFSSNNFYHLKSSINVLILLFILFFLESSLSKKSGFVVILLFVSLIFNSQWLKFIFIDSLMTEGILSYIFFVLFVSCLKTTKLTLANSKIIFFGLGLLYIGKQFISTLSLVIIFIYLFKNEHRKNALFGLFGVFLKEMSSVTYFKNIQKNYHLKEVDLFDTFLDLILFRDLKLTNITIIFKNLMKDVPISLIFFYFLLFSIFYLFWSKNKKTETNLLMFVIAFNFILIFSLYITLWRNMELESPIRYMLNLLPVILYFQFKLIDQELWSQKK